MEIFRRYLTSSAESEQVVGADIVDRLVDRFQSSTRLDDKRDALRALKALSKKYRLEVGTHAMSVFISALGSDSEDSDSVCYAMEGLYAVMNDECTEDVEPQELVNIPSDLGAQFSEIFMKDIRNYELILSYLDASETYIRRNAMRLLTVLSINRLKDTQTAILQCCTGISKLVDILSDAHEVLRNDVILLLTEITKSHPNIQKIVAFENAFERLISIIHSEGLCDGGVVVEDCLRLLSQLLDGNTSNQILFREGNFIKRLLPLLDLSANEQRCWSAQKVVNTQLVMQVIRKLVSPSNKAEAIRSCQNVMHDCGLLEKLCNIVMANGVPTDVLTKSIYALADTIKSCSKNQEYLANLVALTDTPRSAINVLLISMINERQSIQVRLAVLYCFQCYLSANRQAQRAIVMTLLPKPNEAPTSEMSAGQLLCGGLFSDDTSTWFASVALMHCVYDNTELKEELLRVHLASSEGDGSPITLIQQCLISLQTSNRFQTRIGLLQFLCSWLAYCPQAIRHLLIIPNVKLNLAPSFCRTNTNLSGDSTNQGSHLSNLVAEAAAVDNDETEALIRGLATLLICVCVLFNPGDVVGFDKTSLLNTLEKRMGIDIILERLGQVSKAESFVTASKTPEPIGQVNKDLIFDYTFTRLFKRLEYEVMHTFQPANFDNAIGDSIIRADYSKHGSIVIANYEEKFTKQESELVQLRNRVSQLESELNVFRNVDHSSLSATNNVRDHVDTVTVDNLNKKLLFAEHRMKELEQKLSVVENERDTIRSEQDDLLLLLHEQDVKLKKLCKLIKQLGGQIPEDMNDENVPEAKDESISRLLTDTLDSGTLPSITDNPSDINNVPVSSIPNPVIGLSATHNKFDSNSPLMQITNGMHNFSQIPYTGSNNVTDRLFAPIHYSGISSTSTDSSTVLPYSHPFAKVPVGPKIRTDNSDLES